MLDKILSSYSKCFLKKFKFHSEISLDLKFTFKLSVSFINQVTSSETKTAVSLHAGDVQMV